MSGPLRAEGASTDPAPQLESAPVDGPAARVLFERLRDGALRRYPELAAVEVDDLALPDLMPPSGRFLVLSVDGAPVGCGGVRILAPGVAEIKRMYVLPEARRRGYGRGLLRALEDAARELGCGRVRLDTGDRQLEARALYESSGYRRIAPYSDTPLANLWFEKALAP